MTERILVTGAAGFIGFHLANRLLDDGHEVVGVDNLNAYYEVSLKDARLARLQARDGVRFVKLDLADRDGMQRLFADERLDRVAHLAAQAGVRYSLINPYAYVDANLQGFINVLEGCRHASIGHLVYASSSSVYGKNEKLPFSEADNVDHPISLYAATKKANELMAHTYAHLYGLPVTGLRFFTVYGPWGRPDMAAFLFTKAIVSGKPIQVFNRGDMRRDFTYIDDIVEGVVRLVQQPPRDAPPYALYNIGNNNPVQLLDFIAILEELLGVEARRELLPMAVSPVLPRPPGGRTPARLSRWHRIRRDACDPLARVAAMKLSGTSTPQHPRGQQDGEHQHIRGVLGEGDPCRPPAREAVQRPGQPSPDEPVRLASDGEDLDRREHHAARHDRDQQHATGRQHCRTSDRGADRLDRRLEHEGEHEETSHVRQLAGDRPRPLRLQHVIVHGPRGEGQ
jgi:UDP-glucuronate 4-epimerase